MDNFGNGAVMNITKHMVLTDHASPPLNVSFKNCEFHNNSVTSEAKSSILSVFMSHIMISLLKVT